MTTEGPGMEVEPPEAQEVPPPPTWYDRLDTFARGRGAILLVLAVAALINVRTFDPYLNTNGDNAQYLVLGESILTGHGLSHINSPTNDPHTKYPFLYPALIACVLALFPNGLLAVKLLTTAFGIGSAVVVMLLFRSRGRPKLALGIALTTAVSTHVLALAHITLAEVPFMFFSLVALVYLERVLAMPRDDFRGLGGCLIAIMAAYYCKSVGLALALAAPLAFLIRRRFRAAAFLFVGFVALSFPWFLRNKAVGNENLYVDYFLMENPYQEDSPTLDWASFIRRVLVNGLQYERFIVPNALFPDAFEGGPGPGPRVEWVVFLLPLVLIAAGIVSALRGGRLVTEVYVLVFLGIVHVWPEVWAGNRFILPIVPLLVGYAVRGAERVWERVTLARTGEQAALVFAILLVLVNVQGSIRRADRERGYTKDWLNFFAGAAWLRENAPVDTVIASRSAYVLYWFLRDARSPARTKTVGYRFSTDTRAVYEDLVASGAEFVLVDSFFWTRTTVKYIYPMLQDCTDRFALLWESDEPPTFVVRVDPEGIRAP